MNLLQDGYVVDVPYPTFVHRQAMPLWMTLVAQQQAYRAPDMSQPFRYLELGCAMGIHLHLTAASHPQGHFVGVDFNPQQLLVGQEGIERTEIQNIEFIQASFGDLLEQNLEPFDFIITHGVWSWIAEEHQQAMVNIVDQLLKPNGIFYCSYMSHPGATHFSSIQKLMFEMSKNLQGDSATKAVQSLNLARRIGQHQLGLFDKVPSLNRDLTALAQDKPSYIAHDFLSQHWQPQHSADMLRRFGHIGLAYSAGAGILENINRISLTPEISKIVDGLPLITLQETVKDIARNTLQRQDLYIKQRQKMTEQEQSTFYQHCYFALLPDAPVGHSLKFDEKLGRISDAIAIFEQTLQLLNIKNMSINQLYKKLKLKITEAQFSEVLMVLVWAGYIHPSQAYQNTSITEKMNRWMQEQNLPWSVFPELGTAIDLKKPL